MRASVCTFVSFYAPSKSSNTHTALLCLTNDQYMSVSIHMQPDLNRDLIPADENYTALQAIALEAAFQTCIQEMTAHDNSRTDVTACCHYFSSLSSAPAADRRRDGLPVKANVCLHSFLSLSHFVSINITLSLISSRLFEVPRARHSFALPALQLLQWPFGLRGLVNNWGN